MVETHCDCHAKVTDCIEELRKDRETQWNAIDSKVPNAMFKMLITVLVIVLGGIFVAQMQMINSMAVIKTEVQYINQVQRSERKIIDTMEELFGVNK